MRYISPSFLLLIVCAAQLVGCSKQNASQSSTRSATTGIISISRDGSLTYNGAPITIESLKRLLEKRGELDTKPITK